MPKIYEKVKLLKNILTGNVAHVGPSHVNIDITHRCNLKCSWCRWHSPLLDKPSKDKNTVKDIDTNLFKRLCAELKALGTNQLFFVGTGEPILHPHIYDLIATAKDNGLKVTMYTNGTLLTEKRIKSLITSGLYSLRVSIWASSSEEYLKQHPEAKPERFDKIIKGLRMLSNYKTEKETELPRVEFSYAITHSNLKNIDGIVDLAHSTGCNKLFFTVVQAAEGGEKFRPFLLNPDEEQFARASLYRVRRRLNSLGIKHNIDRVVLRYRLGESGWKRVPCYAGWYYAYFNADGKVQPCQRCHMPIGDLQHDSFYDIWNNSKYRAFRKKSLKYEGLVSMKDYCDCNFCPHLESNYRFYQLLRWVPRFQKKW